MTQQDSHTRSIGSEKATLPPSITPLIVLESMPMAAVIFDLRLRVLARNAIAKSQLLDAETMPELLASVRDNEQTDWASAVRNVLVNGRPSVHQRVLSTAMGRVTRYLTLAVHPLRDCREEIQGGLLTAIDANEIVGLETRIDQLEHVAGAANLVARAAHELNNPLDGILRYVNLAIRELDKPHPERIPEYLRSSRDGLLRMMQITSDLLAYGRDVYGQAEPAGINRVVEEAIRAMEDRATGEGIVITADFREENMPMVRGSRLFQVCCNLIKNAIEAMPGGGRLTISSGVVNDKIVLRFEDTGLGLPEPSDRIFEPFFTTKGDQEGTGLGLAICRDFVEQLGGQLTAQPARDGGAVFTVTLPIEMKA